MRSTTPSCNPLLATVKANKHLSLAEKQLLRAIGAAAAGLSAEHQANFIAGSDTVGEQQNADAQNAGAVVLGAAGAAAQLAHAARAALRGTLRG